MTAIHVSLHVHDSTEASVQNLTADTDLVSVAIGDGLYGSKVALLGTLAQLEALAATMNVKLTALRLSRSLAEESAA